MSQIGKQIVDFKVQAFVNDGFKEISKQDVLGKWSVFFFYPADFTFVCPTELEDLADKYGDFQAAGVEVYGVSCDTHFVHKAWHDTSAAIKKVKYPLLADPTGVLARGFDVMIEEAGLAMGTSSPSSNSRIRLRLIKSIALRVFMSIIAQLEIACPMIFPFSFRIRKFRVVLTLPKIGRAHV